MCVPRSNKMQKCYDKTKIYVARSAVSTRIGTLMVVARKINVVLGISDTRSATAALLTV